MGQLTVGSNPTPSAMLDDHDAMAVALDEAAEPRSPTATSRSAPSWSTTGRSRRPPPQRARARRRSDRPRRDPGPARRRRRPRGAGGSTGARSWSPLEPCPMCAGAAGGGPDRPPGVRRRRPQAGAPARCTTCAADPRLNHNFPVVHGVLAAEAVAAARRLLRRDGAPATSARPEGCQSGRMGRPRKPLRSSGLRGFESHSFRFQVFGRPLACARVRPIVPLSWDDVRSRPSVSTEFRGALLPRLLPVSSRLGRCRA